MSDTSSPGRSPGDRRPRAGWGWFVALGIALMLLGAFAWYDVVGLTIVGTVLIGAALLVGGLLQIAHAFLNRSWSDFFLQLAGGILYGIAGLLIMDEPIRGSFVVTLVLAILLIITGCIRLVIAFRHRHLGGAALLTVGGIVSIVVGIVIYTTLPWSGLWVLGTLIAIELIMHGAAWLEFGFALRRTR